jgi:carbon-monoxide dehydrogenase small subunit
MTIEWSVNGMEQNMNVDSGERLLDILRRDFHLMGAKSGCGCGSCGHCLVKLNGEVVCACLVPAFRLKGSEVVTLEGFKNLEEYGDISKGFARAGYHPCPACYSSRVFLTDMLLEKKTELDDRTILQAFDGVKCRCTDPGQLLRAVRCAEENRAARLEAKVLKHGRQRH